jgi:hypothetical protein
LISLKKVDREDEVELELAAEGRLLRYQVSVGGMDGMAFLNLESSDGAGAMIDGGGC